ncbi:MAG: hypothetical protein QOE61_3464 [Micromonosporaceae bacterium]|jgi:hypothetical protein|nr:hypothetical protein [Micromonosporaceae bacterium]
MSFIGGAAAWTNLSGVVNTLDGNWWDGIGGRLTPLNVMTGSRIAASGNGVVRRVGGPTWDEVVYARRVGPRQADQLRRPYRRIFEVLYQHTNRTQEPQVCLRCGRRPHNDWGQEYERLVCLEITST